MKKLIIKNILHHKDKYIFILISAIFAAFFILSAITLSKGSKSGIEKARAALGADLVILPAGTEADESVLYGGSPVTLTMNRKTAEEITKMDFVSKSCIRLYLATLNGASCCDACIQLVGVQDDFLLSALTQKQPGYGEIICGSRLGVKNGEIVRYLGREFTVIDVIDKTGTGVDLSGYIAMDEAYELAEEYGFMKTSETSAVFLQSENARVLDHMIKSRYGNKVDVVAPDKKTSEYVKEVSLIEKGSAVIVFVVLCLSVLVSGAVSYLHTIHRRNETAAYYVLNFKKEKIIALYASEIGIVSILGCIVGILLHIMLFSSFRTLIEHKIGIVILSGNVWLTGLLFTGLFSAIAVFFTILSAQHVLKTEPAELFKEGN